MNFEFECKTENESNPKEAFIATFNFEVNENVDIGYTFTFGIDRREEGYILYGYDEEYSWDDLINGKTIDILDIEQSKIKFSIEEEYFNLRLKGGCDWTGENNLRIKITSEMREKIISEFEKCKKYFE